MRQCQPPFAPQDVSRGVQPWGIVRTLYSDPRGDMSNVLTAGKIGARLKKRGAVILVVQFVQKRHEDLQESSAIRGVTAPRRQGDVSGESQTLTRSVNKRAGVIYQRREKPR